MHDLKLVDKSGKVVRLVRGDQVEALLKTGKVEHINAGKRGEKLRLESHLKVADFKKSGTGVKADVVMGITKAHYREDIGDHPTVAIKRAVKDEQVGTFELHKWDNALTFDDLRNGRLNHFEDEDEHERRVCDCSENNNLPDGAVCLVCGGLVMRDAA